MGTVSNLASKEDFARDMLAELRAGVGEVNYAYQVALAAHDHKYSDEVIIDLALVHAEMIANAKHEPWMLDPIDFRWAIDFLDNLGAFRLRISRIPARKTNADRS